MIAFVKGVLDTIDLDRVVVENQGVGFEILVPGSVAEALPQEGNEVKLYTYTHVREDALQLYGFLTRDEMNMFRMLITVNGIGPKGALGILTAMDVDTLRFAILAGDAKSIAKAPGIGAKTAAKLILELKDKCNLEDMLETEDGLSAGSGASGRKAEAGADNEARNDAIQALVALGYSATEAAAALKRTEITKEMSVEDILKQSLKNL
ncbi:MAG: Holliday junction branch migration protein RuvA [Lachnospiraceae bacterium]|nr:Holliday junction branch migration protein RuvA [Lachnospiraceae bacterium]